VVAGRGAGLPAASRGLLDELAEQRGLHAEDVEHLAGIIQEGIRHKGFALIEVLQPCISFNRQNTNEWYRQKTYKLGQDYDPTDRLAAFAKGLEWGERIPLGVIYKNERPVYEEQIAALKETPLVKQELNPLQFEELLNEFL